MPHYEAKMTSKGQITVPAAVRDFFKLRAGDIVDFYLNDHGRVEIVARNKPVSELFGMLNKHVDFSAGPLTEEAIDDAIGAHLADEHERITRHWNEKREFDAWRQSKRLTVK